MSTTPLQTPALHLVQDLRQIIQDARGRVAAQVNSELTLMYWHIGERINRDVLDNQRAEYGKQTPSATASTACSMSAPPSAAKSPLPKPNNASAKNNNKLTKYQTYEQIFTHSGNRCHCFRGRNLAGKRTSPRRCTSR